MIKDKHFVISDHNNTSTITFDINEGLQQGTVNSPILFNIYTADIINAFKMNDLNQNTYSIAYADDIILYVAGPQIAEIQNDLQQLVNKVNNWYSTWNLKMNPTKSEAILFRKPYRFLTSSRLKNIKTFKIQTFCPITRQPIDIPSKTTVKYLGMQLDNLLRCTTHIKNQLIKANNRFRSLSRLLHNNNITKRARLICYLILVRPLLTYAAPIWWNIGLRVMEKLRVFERQCIRASLRMYRTEASGFTRKTSNKKLYHTANITRIDNFILKLTRNYYHNLKAIDNNTIQNLATIDPILTATESQTGYFKPQAFTFFDRLGIIQNENNIPIIYHFNRNSTTKSLPLNHNQMTNLKYSTAIPTCDHQDYSRIQNKFWWLDETATHYGALKLRSILTQQQQRNQLRHNSRRNAILRRDGPS
uniref:Reverse transcriptase domain-containing protein n=1 Tax=Bracon brevicornis TaxID=1563983 RepID=A0A6V7JHL7_9HYME